ncbi:hypothetical protein DRO61_00910 [Candidatus Bathyarchaeota archaeon]|nr:MAG: hypothetical protein DRO61_00910 [Candidatus Bathyarchaeota archaeon]
MGNRLILGRNFAEQKQGYPVNINIDTIRNFTVLKTAEAVVPGEVLLRTTAGAGIYEGAETATLTAKTAADVMGIAIATNVKTKLVYAAVAGTTDWQPGDKGDYISEGEVSVEFAPSASNITEGDPVYLVIGVVGTPVTADLGKLINAVSTTAADTVLLPGFVWVGETEGTLSIVRKAY